MQLSPDGSFVYVADDGVFGTDTFTYQATTTGAASQVATVTITIGGLENGSIAGNVYFDTNNTGIREAGEHAFGGVEITLTGTDAFGESVDRTVFTGPDGSYSFFEVVPGDYVVTETQPAIVVDGIDSAGGVVSETNDSHVIELGSGDLLSGVDFAERGLQPGYFSYLSFLSSTPSTGAGIAIGPDGSTSWFCVDAGWSGFRSVSATLSGTTINITALSLNGESFVATANARDSNVSVIGNATGGYLIRLNGGSRAYGLVPAGEPSEAAVDALFAS